jgi:hypothetical protein
MRTTLVLSIGGLGQKPWKGKYAAHMGSCFADAAVQQQAQAGSVGDAAV